MSGSTFLLILGLAIAIGLVIWALIERASRIEHERRAQLEREHSARVTQAAMAQRLEMARREKLQKKINEVNHEQAKILDKIDNGGFDASIDVLSNLAARRASGNSGVSDKTPAND